MHLAQNGPEYGEIRGLIPSEDAQQVALGDRSHDLHSVCYGCVRLQLLLQSQRGVVLVICELWTSSFSSSCRGANRPFQGDCRIHIGLMLRDMSEPPLEEYPDFPYRE